MISFKKIWIPVCKKMGRAMSKHLLAILGVSISAGGLYLGWLQYERSRSQAADDAPDVVACIDSIEIDRQPLPGRDGYSVAVVSAALRLVNRGGSPVAVSKVLLNPVGTRRNGAHGGLDSLEPQVNEYVEAAGITAVELSDVRSGNAVRDSFWIDKIEGVNTRASWPGRQGEMLTCRPWAGGTWLCRGAFSRVNEPAC